MKKFVLFLLVFCFAIGLAACGGEEAYDPNLGTYTAETAEMWGIEIDVDEVWEGGFDVELKSGGKCTFTISGESYNAKWSLDGDKIAITGGGLDESGTLSEGVIVLEDVVESGVTLTLVNYDYAPAE